jgi:hypothetical protein
MPPATPFIATLLFSFRHYHFDIDSLFSFSLSKLSPHWFFIGWHYFLRHIDIIRLFSLFSLLSLMIISFDISLPFSLSLIFASFHFISTLRHYFLISFSFSFHWFSFIITPFRFHYWFSFRLLPHYYYAIFIDSWLRFSPFSPPLPLPLPYYFIFICLRHHYFAAFAFSFRWLITPYR